jgi:TRAP-type C4-dicarboxylate transport system permease small subunit
METTRTPPFYNRIEFAIIVCFFTAMVVITAFTVVSRYFFNFTFSWAEQLTRLLFVYVSFAGVSWCGRIGAHMRTTAITLLTGPKVGKWIIFVGDFITVIIGLYLAYKIYGIMMTVYIKKQYFSAMSWCPIWVMYLAGVLGMLGFCLRVIQGWVVDYQNAKQNRTSCVGGNSSC